MARPSNTDMSRDDVVVHCTDWLDMGLGLGPRRDKRNGPPSPRAEAGQENIGTVHEPKPIQTAGPP